MTTVKQPTAEPVRYCAGNDSKKEPGSISSEKQIDPGSFFAFGGERLYIAPNGVDHVMVYGTVLYDHGQTTLKEPAKSCESNH